MRPMPSQSAGTLVGSVPSSSVLHSALDIGTTRSTLPATLDHLTNTLAATTLPVSPAAAAAAASVATTSCQNVSLMIPVRTATRPLSAFQQSHRDDTATVTSASHSTQLVVSLLCMYDPTMVAQVQCAW